ncbi:MAG: hypothetical protein FJ252_09285, partial [Phycisphaerae bacterium]|nr:hypothetical protein [Phycisphaerae bacterium]
LFSLQRVDGHWCAELEGDSILESEYMLMKFILGQEREPMADGRDGWQVMQELAASLRGQQRADGGWGQYPGSAADVSSCVKAWVCLRLIGDDERAPHMQRAAAMILARGGAESCNSFTNFYLAALGLIPWMAVPAIPPEVVWLPRWFPFHLSKVSAWSRTMILPLAIVAALRPTRRVRLTLEPITHDLGALRRLTMRREVPAGWRAFFRAIDLGLKGASALIGPRPRGPAIRDAFTWIMQRASQDGPARTEGVGAIFPPMVYLQIVFKALGIPRNDPRVQVAERDLDAFFLRDARGTRLQPCFSPVWDTGIGLYALTDAGFDASDPRVAKACSWLESHEVTHAGDWALNCAPGTAAGGWCFEYANAWYPDCDDTAMVAMALHRARRGSSGAGAVGASSTPTRGTPTAMTRRWWPWLCTALGAVRALRGIVAPGGSWRCRTTTVAGLRSTAPSTASGWSTCRSPTTMPCRIHRARTSPVACSSACRRRECAAVMWPSIARSATSSPTSCRKGASSVVGA